MRSINFSGTGVALITPFTKTGQIDFSALEKLIEHCIQGGVDYLVSLGTTGEAITLSRAECLEVFAFTKKINNSRVGLMAGLFGHNDTAALQERIQNFDFTGFDGMLSSSPAYNKPTQEGIYQHYMKIAEVAPVPIVIYNVPGRTSSKVAPETILRLANATKKFVAVKDATGDLVAGAKIIKDKPAHFQVLSGDDPTALPLLSIGGTGIISVIGNLLPGPYSQMVKAAMTGDFATARAIHLATIKLHDWLYLEGNPTGIKAALEIAGISERNVRLPLVSYPDDAYLEMKKEIESVLEALKAGVA